MTDRRRETTNHRARYRLAAVLLKTRHGIHEVSGVYEHWRPMDRALDVLWLTASRPGRPTSRST